MTAYLLYMVSPIFVAIFVSLLTKESIFNDKSSKRLFFIFCFIIIALMIGLRHYTNGSGDTLFYCKQWKQIAAMSLNQFKSYAVDMDMEKGYLYSVFALSRIFQNINPC